MSNGFVLSSIGSTSQLRRNLVSLTSSCQVSRRVLRFVHVFGDHDDLAVKLGQIDREAVVHIGADYGIFAVSEKVEPAIGVQSLTEGVFTEFSSADP